MQVSISYVTVMSEAGGVQDAVSFLEDAHLVYPDVTHLLNKVQLLALDMDPREPFTRGSENEEFVRVSEAFFLTKLNCQSTKSDLRAALMEPRAKGKPLDVSEKERVIRCLEMVRGICRGDVCVWRANACGERPCEDEDACNLYFSQ